MITVDESKLFDVTVKGSNHVFSEYRLQNCKETFNHYFNRNLNPDNAVLGFLEDLSVLVEIAKIREVVILTDNTELENEQAEVLNDYLSSFYPKQ